MNTVIMSGRTTKDIEVRDAGATKVANFSLAVDRDRKVEGQPEVDFHDCTIFGKSAEAMAKHVGKGSQILVRGALQNNQFTDRDGKSRVNKIVMVDKVEFIALKAPAGADGAPVADDDEIPFA